MFTGIISHIGVVKKLNKADNQDLIISLDLGSQKTDRKLEIGCSIACNGICLTLIKKNGLVLDFAASDETINKTNIKNWQVGDKINVEFALKMGDELGGHLVSGHIDTITEIADIKKINQDSWRFSFAIPQNLQKFIAAKGSIVLNGTSLTVNNVFENHFDINIIKHTFDNTNFNICQIGDEINLEIDLIARHLNRLHLDRLNLKK